MEDDGPKFLGGKISALWTYIAVKLVTQIEGFAYKNPSLRLLLWKVKLTFCSYSYALN